MVQDKTHQATPARRKRGRPPRDASDILDAAVEVFAREGYANATIEMIAAEASASTATLYKRFSNKHGLFVAVLDKTTSLSLGIHVDHRQTPEHEFSAILNRLKAHATVASDPKVRGVMRAWVGEVRSQSELKELFAVKSGRELVTGLIGQLKKLEASGLLAFPATEPNVYLFAAQIMLGIVERFTLVRGLILGDASPSVFSIDGIVEAALHSVIGIWGTEKGKSTFASLEKSKINVG